MLYSTTPQKHCLIKKVNLGTQFSLLLQYNMMLSENMPLRKTKCGHRVHVSALQALSGASQISKYCTVDLFLKLCIAAPIKGNSGFL